MTRVVVDTDVASFIFKNHSIGARYEPDLAGCTLLISFHDGGGTGSMGHPIQVGAGAPRMAAAVSRTIRAAAVQAAGFAPCGPR